jgi:hypothetical protein
VLRPGLPGTFIESPPRNATVVSPDVTERSGKANRERWRLATTTSMSPEHVCGLRILPPC